MVHLIVLLVDIKKPYKLDNLVWQMSEMYAL